MTTEYNAPANAMELIKVQAAAIRGFTATRGAMHKALVMTLLHVAKHGDWNGAKQFLIAIKKDEAARTIAKKVEAWLENYGGMVISRDKTNKDTLGTIVGCKGADYIMSRIEEAKAHPYYEREQKEKGNSYKGFSFDSAIKAVLDERAKALKHIAENPADKDKVSLNPSAQMLALLFDAIGLQATLEDESIDDQLAAVVNG